MAVIAFGIQSIGLGFLLRDRRRLDSVCYFAVKLGILNKRGSKVDKVAFKEAVQAELSRDELEGLRMYQVVSPTTGAKLLFMPIIRKAGLGGIQWTARLHYRGAMGYVRLGKNAIEVAGFPSDYYDKAKIFLAQLQEQYAVLPASEAKLELVEGKIEAQRVAEGLPELPTEGE